MTKDSKFTCKNMYITGTLINKATGQHSDNMKCVITNQVLNNVICGHCNHYNSAPKEPKEELKNVLETISN